MSSRPVHSGRHVLDGTFWVMLAQMLMVPTGLVTVAYLTRALGPAGYGQYAVILTMITWAEFALVAVFNRTTVKFISAATDWRPVATAVLQLNLLLGVAAMVAVWLLAGPIAEGLGNAQLAGAIRLAAVDIPLFVLGHAYLQVMIGLGRFRRKALTGAARWVVRLALIVLFVELGFSLRGAILGCIGASVVELFVGRWLCPAPLLARARFPMRRLWSYAAPLFVSALCLRLLSGLDLVALKALGGAAAEAGLYAAALNMALLPGIAGSAVTPVLLSTVSRLRAAGNEPRARWMSAQAVRGVFVLLPLAAVLAGSASGVTRLLFGAPFEAAGPLLAVLLVAGMSRLFIGVATAIVTATDRPAWTVAIALPMVPLALAGYWWVVPVYGPRGAAVTTAAVCLVGVTIGAATLFGLWRIVPPMGSVVRCVAVAGLAYAASLLWPAAGAWVVLKLATLSAAVLAALLALGEFDAAELALVRTMFLKRVKRGDEPKAGEVAG